MQSRAGFRATSWISGILWKPKTVTLDSADFEIGEGKVHVGKVSYDIHDQEQALAVAINLENADFRRLLGPATRSAYPLHMFISGNVAADVTPGKDFEVDGNADLSVRDFSFDNQKPTEKRPLKVLLAVPQVSVKTKFSLDEDGFAFEQTEAVLPNSKLKASGKVDSVSGFDIDVRGPISLSDIRKLGPFDIGGDGQLHWTIKGKKPDVVFSFEAELEDAYYLNLKLGDVKGKVVYNDGNDLLYFYDLSATQGRSQFIANGTIDTGASDAANMTVQVPKGTIQDFSTVFSGFLEKSVPWYPYEISGQISGLIKVSGKTSLDQLSVEGDMDLNNVDYLHEIFHSGKVHGGYRRGAYIAENISIRKKNGTIKGNLVYGADDALKFDLHSDGLTTLDIDRLASLGIPYRAPISFDTQGMGKLGLLKSSFRLNFGDGLIKTYSVPHTEIAFNTENGRVRGDISVFAGQVKGRMDVGWERGSSSSIDVDARHFDFQPLLIGMNTVLADDAELDSEVSGSAHVKFQTGALSKLSGAFALSSYTLRRHGYSLSLVKPAVFDVQGGSYQFTGLKFAGDGTQLSVNGSAHDGDVDYTIGGHLNLGIFEFPVAEIAFVHGSADVDAKVFGHADSPRFKAAVKASGFDLRLQAIEQPFEEGQFVVDWTDGLLRVSDVAARFAGGAVKGSGTIQLYPTKVPDLDLKMDLDNSKIKVYPVAYARTSGKLALNGKDLPYKVKGSLAVADALIKENFDISDNLRALRTSKFLPQKNVGGVGEMQIFDLDIDIAADRNIVVRNDLFDTELKGSIKVINSVQTPRVMGQATILHGRLLFKDNFFAIQSGNIFFRNPATLDPEFDLSGQLDTKGYKILLVASGSASNPNITFTSQPPLSQNDIVNLLTLGVTSSGYQNIARENRDAYSRDELYGLLFSQSGVNKGLQQKLGVKVRVDQSTLVAPESAFRPRSGTDAAETVAPKVVVQKEVTKNLNASVGSTVGVGDNQERNVNLEYDLNKHWSVLGTYEDQHGSQPSQSRTSVGADLKYKLRF
ncbi:MAG: translocation/assembly module TamB domain-containing protein [Deltaproteobacteria bacterium]|nr:translocation/assembly module TamB domain-containing protein [Deltaproteobacteria bacterium]